MITRQYQYEKTKVINMRKDKIGRKIITEFAALRAKVSMFRKVDRKLEEKHCNSTKKCVVAESLNFDDY